jgi:hypothetical protein
VIALFNPPEKKAFHRPRIFFRWLVHGVAAMPLEHATGWRVSLQPTRRSVMDWNRVEGNWMQVKGKIKEQWAG